ncbi:leader peptidase (prepilin peptidase)/N-methyltransferase [Phycicoccus badiiscoriae]|uniref:Leader peptidase (Prepilin peptidase)/N-methyltransferase n=1 Tax=Pedococcus badiiscoriae TaxID=642776 RepID=A0A852WHM3_9MICO|nr:A24 family peptidase [Pedococcus badiiscoriae]NYG08279.1 leader peptidase (prepilin peptidase)/N-methyltransferase [Pedococcus badiiscoriae]
MIDVATGSGVAAWVVLLLAVAGAGLGALTGRTLARAGYRIESDEAGAPPRHWWWPAVELALLWALVGWRFGDFAGWAALPPYLLFAWLAVGLVWIDADVHRLPDGLVLPAYPALLVLVVIATAGLGDWSALVRALACLAGMYALYFVLAFVSPSSLGFGDVKLSGLIGLLLGWIGVGQAVVGLLAAFVVGGLIAVVMLVGQRVGLRSHIAFGPSMIAGAFVALVFEYHVLA